MELQVEKPKKLEDGKHEGVIIDVEYRQAPFAYTDLVIECEQVRMKVGYPTVVSESSSLGELLERFGHKLKVGTKVDPSKVLVGKKCTFMTMAKKGKDGKEYSNIIASSVKSVV